MREASQSLKKARPNLCECDGPTFVLHRKKKDLSATPMSGGGKLCDGKGLNRDHCSEEKGNEKRGKSDTSDS